MLGGKSLESKLSAFDMLAANMCKYIMSNKYYIFCCKIQSALQHHNHIHFASYGNAVFSATRCGVTVHWKLESHFDELYDDISYKLLLFFTSFDLCNKTKCHCILHYSIQFIGRTDAYNFHKLIDDTILCYAIAIIRLIKNFVQIE